MAAWKQAELFLVAATMWLVVSTSASSSSAAASSSSFPTQGPLLGVFQAGGSTIRSYHQQPSKQQHFQFVSYGALSADRVPCAPMSGRSYYTPNCVKADGPPDCYARQCSTITRCARDSS